MGPSAEMRFRLAVDGLSGARLPATPRPPPCDRSITVEGLEAASDACADP